MGDDEAAAGALFVLGPKRREDRLAREPVKAVANDAGLDEAPRKGEEPRLAGKRTMERRVEAGDL